MKTAGSDMVNEGSVNNGTGAAAIAIAAPLLFLIIAIFPATVRGALQCDPAVTTAHGSFFTTYQQDEYSPQGFLIQHFKNNPDYPYATPFRLRWQFLDDECNPAGTDLPYIDMPTGITDWSLRFASSTEFDIWDDQRNTLIASTTIGAYPAYASFALQGTIEPEYITGTHMEARTDKIRQGGEPPLTDVTLPKDPACPSMFMYNNFFDPAYEHAEYVNHLLRVHLRFTGLPYSGGWMRTKTLSIPSSCSRDPVWYQAPWHGVTMPRLTKYFSFRMTSPAHWILWNDETDTPIACSADPADYYNNGCAGDLDPSAPYISFYMDIGGGSVALFMTTPYAPTEQGCAVDCNDNVLFIPGIEASRLYDTEGGEKQLWEPNSDADALQLTMTPTGASTREDIYTRDVLDEAYIPTAGPNVYKSFIAQMNTLKNENKIADWKAAPYDWRLSLDQILTSGLQTGAHISYLNATDTPYIIQQLKHLASTSRTGKVTIIAHSNGGLVAKALMQKLGATTTADLIDKVIFVAVPQTGTPATVGALLHGKDQSIPFRLSAAAARSVSQNMPSVYNLLPSSNYFTYVDDPVVTFDPFTLPDWASKYGDTIHSSERLRNFITDSARAKPSYGDLATPEVNNAQLFDDAQTAHALLDSWTPPDGVQVIEIAGWGNDTLSGLAYRKVRTCFPGTTSCTSYRLTFNPKHVVDGDGTVIAPSALWTNGATSTRFWVDLSKYNAFVPDLLAVHHRDILEIPQLRTLLSDILTATTTASLPQYLSTSTPPFSGSRTRLRFTLHSPLTLGFIDTAGNYTGATTTGIVSNVPGVTYERYGDVQWLSIPADMTGTLVMHGIASGSFTLDAEQAIGDTVISTTSFEGIPSSTSTIATLDINPAQSITASSTLAVDRDGDGTTDLVLHAKENAIVVPDITPPELRITFATSTNTIAFNGTDDQSIPTITATTSYPAFKTNQEYKGIATTTVTAKDEAGNTAALIYTRRLPSRSGWDTITLTSLAYNGATTTLASTSVSYKWMQRTDNSYHTFTSFILAAATSTESRWRPKKNVTIFMTRPIELDDTDVDDTDTGPTKQTLLGMIIPGLVTERGSVNINY